MKKNEIYDYIDKNQSIFIDVNDKVWDYAETAFEEVRSMACISEALEKFGFTVEKGIGDIPTAFLGSYGSGYPVIGILGEYDALSGLSQTASCIEKKAIIEGGNGHGCGHNSLGAGSLAAAVAVKEYLAKNGKNGTIKYFGCPGEEGGSGKTFMVREGVFKDVDIALTWHPGNYNSAADLSLLANYQINYIFKGRSSHAAAAPHYGRSALDALELMNVGVQFLREHIIPEARIHYAITNTGGFSPNVVQSEAEVVYLIRAPKLNQVEEIYQRVNKIAQGMAMATETEVKIDFIKACANIVPNKILSNLLDKNLREAPIPSYTEEELSFAKSLDDTIPSKQNIGERLSGKDAEKFISLMKDKNLFDSIMPYYHEREVPVLPGSSDVGDVSWVVPTGQIGTACTTIKTMAHTWQFVSIGRTSIAHKGMLYAAKTLAGAAIDILENDTIILEAKDELKRRLDDNKYSSPIPNEVKPRALSSIASH